MGPKVRNRMWLRRMIFQTRRKRNKLWMKIKLIKKKKTNWISLHWPSSCVLIHLHEHRKQLTNYTNGTNFVYVWNGISISCWIRIETKYRIKRINLQPIDYLVLYLYLYIYMYHTQSKELNSCCLCDFGIFGREE